MVFLFLERSYKLGHHILLWTKLCFLIPCQIHVLEALTYNATTSLKAVSPYAIKIK